MGKKNRRQKDNDRVQGVMTAMGVPAAEIASKLPPVKKTEAPVAPPKLAATEEIRIIYLISHGPIRSQIYQAHADAFNQDLKHPASVTFSFRAYHYQSRTRRCPASKEEAIITLQVTNIGYDESPVALRANHLVISGVIITPPDPKITVYEDYQDLTVYQPFQTGTKLKLFYRLDNRLGALIRIEYLTDRGMEIIKPGIPRDYNYIASNPQVITCAT